MRLQASARKTQELGGEGFRTRVQKMKAGIIWRCASQSLTCLEVDTRQLGYRLELTTALPSRGLFMWLGLLHSIEVTSLIWWFKTPKVSDKTKKSIIFYDLVLEDVYSFTSAILVTNLSRYKGVGYTTPSLNGGQGHSGEADVVWKTVGSHLWEVQPATSPHLKLDFSFVLSNPPWDYSNISQLERL